MVRSAERSLAQVAAEWLLSRVLPVMSRQFVRACKFPSASVPRALVRFFPGVSPLVRFQMGTFRVDFVATYHVASVDFSSPQGGSLFRRFVGFDVVVVVRDRYLERILRLC